MPTGHRPAPPVGTARVAVSGTYQGHPWVSVMYLELTGTGITINDLSTLAGDIATDWDSNFKGFYTSAVVLTQVDIRYIPSLGNELRFVGAYSHAGTNGGTTGADASACYVLSWVISDYYRGGHPRTYLPGVPANLITNGSDIDATTFASLISNANSYRSAINALTTTNITGVQIGTVRFASNNAWLSPPRFVPFTGVKAGKKLKLGSQRRRILA